MAQLQNFYNLRHVPESGTSACYICYRPTTTVLVTPDKSDFFFTCPGHLLDPGFVFPVGPSAEELEAKHKAALEKEVERVKAEFEAKKKEKEAKKKEKEKEKEKGKEDDKGKDKKEDKDKKKKDEDKDKDKEKKAEEEKKPPQPGEEGGPKSFTLHKKFFDMRVARQRQLFIAKRNQERIKDPNFWPSVPRGGI